MPRRTIASAIRLSILVLVSSAFGEEPPIAPILLDDATAAKLREVAFQAAREGDVQTLRAYLDADQPADIRNARGDTLLILAAYYGHTEAVAEILKRPKLETDAVNAMGLTALTAAAFKGDLPTARLLLTRGADPNGGPGAARTPLMFAAIFGRTDAAKLLIDHGANPSQADAAGATALTLAEAQGNAAMAELRRDALVRDTRRNRSPRKPVEARKPVQVVAPR